MIEDSNVIDSSLMMDEQSSSAEIGNESILESTNILKSKEQEYNEKKIHNSTLNLEWGCVLTFFNLI
jgi:hypothetical protein